MLKKPEDRAIWGRFVGVHDRDAEVRKRFILQGILRCKISVVDVVRNSQGCRTSP
jgi:hypothetical protein